MTKELRDEESKSFEKKKDELDIEEIVQAFGSKKHLSRVDAKLLQGLRG